MSCKPCSSADGWMAEPPRIHLYCEDDGHDQFVRSLVQRLALEIGVEPSLATVSGRGGHGKALAELKAWQHQAAKGGMRPPDLLVVVIDTNCRGWHAGRQDVLDTIDTTLFQRFVVGCPDPHVERWCIADPVGFALTVGGPPLADPGKCERDLYKRLLRESLERAGQPILTNEMEFAPELVASMNLHRAGKAQPSLRGFIRDLRSGLKALMTS